MRQFDWENLHHFLALAERLNLAAAAADLGTSPVTVMRRVRSLEQSLGTTLFVRRKDGHLLTREGVRLLNLAREAAVSLSDVETLVSGRDAQKGGLLRIATTELGANWILLPQLQPFLASHPDLSVEIDASPRAIDLLDQDATIALRFSRPETGPYTMRKLGTVSFAFFAAPGAVHKPALGWAGDFRGIRLDRALRHHTEHTQVRLTTLQGHLAACRAGMGPALLPEFVCKSDPTLERIEDGVVLEAWLVVPEQIRHASRVALGRSFVTKAFAAVVTE